MNPIREDPELFKWYARVDWVLAMAGRRVLHAVPDDAWTAVHEQEIAEGWAVFTPIRLACGCRARVFIAGMFSRLGARRCARCCRATGLPPGIGAPKNDPECRVILGLTEGNEG